MMMIEANPDALLGLIETIFNPYRADEANPTDLFFPDRNTFLNFKDSMNDFIEQYSQFMNVSGGAFIVDKSESMAQFIIFLIDEEGVYSLTKTFSINY